MHFRPMVKKHQQKKERKFENNQKDSEKDGVNYLKLINGIHQNK